MTTAYDAPHDELDGPRRWGPTRVALTLVVVAMVAMWVWIFLFAPRTNPDRLRSLAFAEAAEAVCAPAQERIDELPTGRDVDTPQQRAAQVEQATVLTETMVADLRAAASEGIDDVDDRRIVDAWFADWDFYIEDRWIHVAKLEAADLETPDRDLRFTLRERAEGGIYTRRIDGLANVNDMESCHVPGDI